MRMRTGDPCHHDVQLAGHVGEKLSTQDMRLKVGFNLVLP